MENELRAYRSVLCCVLYCVGVLHLYLVKACLHLFVLLRVTFGNERTSDCG
ncbi:hypothetical protein T03_2005 [Trichinella britovi]|uniref:Uncharacterized protein n=1 Tax=Trichinella britovi TaxID=45882 RepID=A0A0V1AU12_TRIBR|nr:hypothetical protein T03_2005 [Trichinella britovi]